MNRVTEMSYKSSTGMNADTSMLLEISSSNTVNYPLHCKNKIKTKKKESKMLPTSVSFLAYKP
jgi:hypothetical protein